MKAEHTILFDPSHETMDWSRIDHFVPDEFDDPGHPDSHRFMDPLTIIRLNLLRKTTGWPIVTHNKHGLRGCVCVEKTGHCTSSLHYAPNCSAVDFHFRTHVDARAQAMKVFRSGFTGIGLYYDWEWRDGEPLAIGFHVDNRKRPQVWRRRTGQYIYFLR